MKNQMKAITVSHELEQFAETGTKTKNAVGQGWGGVLWWWGLPYRVIMLPRRRVTQNIARRLFISDWQPWRLNTWYTGMAVKFQLLLLSMHLCFFQVAFSFVCNCLFSELNSTLRFCFAPIMAEFPLRWMGTLTLSEGEASTALTFLTTICPKSYPSNYHQQFSLRPSKWAKKSIKS